MCHRYLATPAYAAHDKDVRKQRIAADTAKRKAEEALIKLHARQNAPIAAADSLARDGTDGSAALAPEAEINPFLRRPLWEEQSTPVVTG